MTEIIQTSPFVQSAQSIPQATQPGQPSAARPAVERLQVTINEAAEMLGISRATVWRMLERGELPSTGRGRLRRVPVAVLRKWVEQNTTRG